MPAAGRSDSTGSAAAGSARAVRVGAGTTGAGRRTAPRRRAGSDRGKADARLDLVRRRGRDAVRARLERRQLVRHHERDLLDASTPRSTPTRESTGRSTRPEPAGRPGRPAARRDAEPRDRRRCRSAPAPPATPDRRRRRAGAAATTFGSGQTTRHRRTRATGDRPRGPAPRRHRRPVDAPSSWWSAIDDPDPDPRAADRPAPRPRPRPAAANRSTAPRRQTSGGGDGPRPRADRRAVGAWPWRIARAVVGWLPIALGTRLGHRGGDGLQPVRGELRRRGRLLGPVARDRPSLGRPARSSQRLAALAAAGRASPSRSSRSRRRHPVGVERRRPPTPSASVALGVVLLVAWVVGLVVGIVRLRPAPAPVGPGGPVS